MVRIGLLLLILGSMVFGGCTRSTQDDDNFSFSLSNQSVSSLSVPDFVMGYVALNLRYPNGKIVFRSFELSKFYENSSGVPPQTLPGIPDVVFKHAGDATNPFAGQFEIVLKGPDITPASGVKFQLIVVDEAIPGSAVEGQQRFRYTEQNNVNVGGNTDIVVSNFLDSQIVTQEVKYAGRYLTSVGPDAGPSGPLAFIYEPPNGSEPMKVHETFMINGWFEALAFDTVNISLFLEPHFFNGFNPQMILEDVNASSAFLSNTGNHRARFDGPAYYRSNNGGSPEKRIQTSYVAGFFTDASNAPVNASFSSRGVCYPQRDMAIPEVYLDPAGTDPVLFKYTGASGQDLGHTAGGFAQVISDYEKDMPCMFKDGNHMAFFPHRVAEGDGTPFGVKMPFAMMNTFDEQSPFVNRVYNFQTTDYTFSWRMLPGTQGLFQNLTMFVRQQDSSPHDHMEDDENCRDFANKGGFSDLGDVPSSAPFIQLNLQPGEVANMELLLCPYFNSPFEPDGKGYIESGIHLRDMLPDDDPRGFGYGTTDLNLAAGDFFDGSGIGGNYAKVTNVDDVAGFPNLMRVDIGGLSGPVPIIDGDEIVLSIHSRDGGSTACGTSFHAHSNGTFSAHDLEAGDHTFYRVIEQVSATQYHVERKGIVNSIFNSSAAANLTVTPDTSTAHCGLYLTKVIEFRDLIMNPTRAIDARTFSYANGGGVIAVRASRKIEMQGSGAGFLANARGYNSQNTPSVEGDGDFGPGGIGTTSSGGDGATIANQGAGGGGGAGGRAGTSLDGLAGGQRAQGEFAFGGAGGQDDGASNATGPRDGYGGGVVFATAPRLVVDDGGGSSTSFITAKGHDGQVDAGPGGGGSLILKFGEIVVSADDTLDINAYGGDSASPFRSGVGGGGRLDLQACNWDTTNWVVNISEGTGGGTTGVDMVSWSETDIQSHFCN